MSIIGFLWEHNSFFVGTAAPYSIIIYRKFLSIIRQGLVTIELITYQKPLPAVAITCIVPFEVDIAYKLLHIEKLIPRNCDNRW